MQKNDSPGHTGPDWTNEENVDGNILCEEYKGRQTIIPNEYRKISFESKDHMPCVVKASSSERSGYGESLLKSLMFQFTDTEDSQFGNAQSDNSIIVSNCTETHFMPTHLWFEVKISE